MVTTTAKSRHDALINGIDTPRYRGHFGGESEGGGSPSITPLPNSKTRSYVGIDNLNLMYQVDWSIGLFDATMAELEAAKEAAGDDEQPQSACSVSMGGRTWLVKAAGSRKGKGCGPFMRYIAESGGITILLARRQSAQGDQPNMSLEFGALACLAAGDLVTLKETARGLVEAMGARIREECVSRLDVFCDLEGVDSEAVVWDFIRGHRIMRLQKGAMYGLFTEGLDMQGLRVGKGSGFRVYDKIEELAKSAHKRPAWEAIEWGGQPPQVCTRFEFQLRRDFLRKRDIGDLDQLAEKLGPLLAYLAGDGSNDDRAWIRFTAEKPDRQNTTRAASAGYWTRLQEAFAAHTPASGKLDSRKDRLPAVKHLVDMSVGCVEAIAAVEGVDCVTVDDFVGFMVEKIYEHASGRMFERSIKEKRARLEAMCPMDAKPDAEGVAGPPLRALYVQE